jgi:hypothetical protein
MLSQLSARCGKKAFDSLASKRPFFHAIHLQQVQLANSKYKKQKAFSLIVRWCTGFSTSVVTTIEASKIECKLSREGKTMLTGVPQLCMMTLHVQTEIFISLPSLCC